MANPVHINKKIYGIFGLLLTASIMGGCASTKQARDVEPSGFLGDYSMLREGREGEALMLYIHPDYERACQSYDKVLIDPVTLWATENSDLAELPAEDRQALVNHLHGSLVSELGKYYRIVQTPRPGTLRVRAAITEAEGSWVTLDTVSSFVPQMLVMSKLKEVATGTAAFVGKASAEAEIIDIATGERIAAGVDRQVGGKTFSGVTKQWNDVETAFDLWARRLAYRLANCGAMLPEE
ncbi:DUF3313 domain-containing protein [Methylohalobius crimeensis]|uniref:DUF3313 domain-containing protein n=1 Tax=Methylohalobius crimeensis TaxID=244365 RepID=UPI0003FAEFD8|nr:DUF3313 domain-containing protein [Methylohalobius crimeensis]